MNSAILLVDDNAIQAATRQTILENTGLRVVTALSGQEALSVLASLDTIHKIGLVITDHVMPGMDGPALVEQIRQRGWNIPVLVLSGLPDAESAYEHLNVTFRMKPCAPDSLIALVRQLLCHTMPRSA